MEKLHIYILALLSIIHIISAQTIFNGSNFNIPGDKYMDNIISCSDNSDCTINCKGGNSCYNTTILCPNNGACNVKCSYWGSCEYTDIHWVQGNANTFICDTSHLKHANGICARNRNPPSITESTPLFLTCNRSNWCKERIITCPDNALCQISCTHTGSCESAIIYCPSTSTCDIQCIERNACMHAVVYWSYTTSANSTLTCPVGGNQCNLIQLPTVKDPPNENDAYNLTCNQNKQCASAKINCPSNGHCMVNCHEKNSCPGSIINCPFNADCYIECTKEYSCYGSIINGPTGFTLYVLCGGEFSCRGLTVFARESGNFILNVTANSQGAATDTTFYFPPQDPITNEARAQIFLANTKSLTDDYGHLIPHFHAINGWQDVDITYATATWKWWAQGGIMYCGSGYSLSCPFDNNSYSCDPVNTICDNPWTIPPTEAPSTPSPAPTESPTNSSLPSNPLNIFLIIFHFVVFIYSG